MVKTYEEYYPQWMSDSTKKKKEFQIKKQSKMDDDDPKAYQELPGDTKGKNKLKVSKHTLNYQKKFGKNEEAEGSMYIFALESIVKNAQETMDMINPDEDLPAWVQDKITIAKHNMEAISGYLKNPNQ